MPAHVWTLAEQREIYHLWAHTNWSAREIANVMTTRKGTLVTRNAIIGLMHRYAIGLRADHQRDAAQA